MRNKKGLIFTIILCIITVYFASDLYLPAMPMMRDHFHCTTTQMQLTLSLYFLGAAIAQFVSGPILDNFGYRRIAINMAIVFIISSLACAFSFSLLSLIIFRIIQAFSLGTLSIIGRATLGRSFSKVGVTQLFLIISPINAASPGLAPVIGGYLTPYFNWPSVFCFLAIAGIFLLFFVCRYIRITKKEVGGDGFHPKTLLKTYWHIISNHSYFIYLIIFSAVFAEYFAYITESPFIFHNMGYGAKSIGHFYISIAVAFIVATQINRILKKFFSEHQLIALGLSINLAGLFLLYLAGFFHVTQAAYLYLPVGIVCFSNGLSTPFLASKLTSLFPNQSAYATSLYGTGTLLATSITASVIHKLTNSNVVFLANYMLAMILVAILAFSTKLFLQKIGK